MPPLLKGKTSLLLLMASEDGVLRLVAVSKEGSQLLLAVKTHACTVQELAVDPAGSATKAHSSVKEQHLHGTEGLKHVHF